MITIERPDIADGQQFIQWTANHQSAALALPPAAMHLWQYLLRKNPAGVPIEIDLSEELETISAGRSRPYSQRSLKDALIKHLASSKHNLVEIIKDYGRSTFKVIAHHAGPVKEVTKYRISQVRSVIVSLKASPANGSIRHGFMKYCTKRFGNSFQKTELTLPALKRQGFFKSFCLIS